jgi:hypothetical protein
VLVLFEKFDVLMAKKTHFVTHNRMQIIKIFTELPGMYVEQWKAFPSSAVIWISLIGNVYRLLVCQLC